MPQHPHPQPLTPGGVAACAHASWGWVLLLELVAGLVGAGVLVWFLLKCWCPVIREAIGHLPETGEIRRGRLNIAPGGAAVLAGNRYLALVAAPVEGPATIPNADVVVRFRSEAVELCTLLGCLELKYSPHYTIQFNRPELQPWWDAWQPVLLGAAAVATVLGGLLVWGLVAAVYALPVRLLSGWLGRSLRWGASWKLASAALLPGALLLELGVVLYGLGILDWVRLALAAVFQVLLGWVYLATAWTLVQPSPPRPAAAANPFAPPPPPPSA